jgi:antirestriction protein
MTLSLYAQPYDISAGGFYFTDLEDYNAKVAITVNDFGQPVEEFEIQFIDGEDMDCDLAKAMDINQANLKHFFMAVDEWTDDQKIRFIIAVGDCRYGFDFAKDHPDDFDVDYYHVENLIELAHQFIDDGLFGDIRENLICYLDYAAIARDLSMDYDMITVAGERLAYRCG